MAMIQVTGLTFGYEDSLDLVFQNASFQIDTSWKLGLIGRNGRGKTTFLRLLMGQLPYQGTIVAPSGFSYFPFPVRDQAQMTYSVIEELVPGLELWQLQRELSLLETGDSLLWRSFHTLSPGEQTKVLLAGLFLREDQMLLIDEPTNHLDQHARQIVGRYLSQKKGFLLVSHDRTFLDSCIDHVLSIQKKNIVVQKGNYSSWQREKTYRDQLELQQHTKLKKEIRQMQASARRLSDWSGAAEKEKHVRTSGLRPDRGFLGHKAAKIMKRSKIIAARREEAIEEKSALLQDLDTAPPLTIPSQTYDRTTLFRIEDVAVSYGGRQVCEPVSFTVQRGDRVALCGSNGCGKSSLLKLMIGQPLDHTGTLTFGSGVRVSYVPQDTRMLSGSLRAYAQKEEIDETQFFTILRKMDFPRTQFEKDMHSYSEGQKKKVLLASSLCQRAHLFLWDEPLNYIDIFSRMQLEELILRDQPAMVFVEHDNAFCRAVATKEIILTPFHYETETKD